jgi:hypothetical protein
MVDVYFPASASSVVMQTDEWVLIVSGLLKWRAFRSVLCSSPDTSCLPAEGSCAQATHVWDDDVSTSKCSSPLQDAPLGLDHGVLYSLHEVLQ